MGSTFDCLHAYNMVEVTLLDLWSWITMGDWLPPACLRRQVTSCKKASYSGRESTWREHTVIDRGACGVPALPATSYLGLPKPGTREYEWKGLQEKSSPSHCLTDPAWGTKTASRAPSAPKAVKDCNDKCLLLFYSTTFWAVCYAAGSKRSNFLGSLRNFLVEPGLESIHCI